MIVFENEAKNLAYNVRWIREQNGLSKKEMARMLSISVESLRKIEAEQIPTRLVVHVPFRIATLFNVTTAELYSERLNRAITTVK